MNCSVTLLDEDVAANIHALPSDIRARFFHIVNMVQSYGLDRMYRPHIKHMGSQIWEIKIQGCGNILAILYSTMIEKNLVIFHAVQRTGKIATRLSSRHDGTRDSL